MNKFLLHSDISEKKITFFSELSRKGIMTIILILFIMPVFAQQGEPKVTINLQNATFETFIKAIEKQTNYKFLYRDDIIDKTKSITINCNAKSLKEVLNEQLPKLNLNYKITDQTIVLSVRKDEKIVVKGVVLDEFQNPIIGATVLCPNSTQGAITDHKGVFQLKLDSPQDIEIAFVGFKSITKNIESSLDNLIVTLSLDVMDIQDVVVTGYQVMTRGQNAGASSSRKGEELMRPGLTSIDQMLQGKIAGMMVMNTSGEPSATPKIRVRGNSTLSGNKAPVWVLDGVILEQPVVFDVSNINSDDAAYLIGNAIAGINPNDIETITVLKDAAATAIYGVKAANGVIVVTTKKGAIGRPIISYNGGITFNTRPSYDNFDRMTATERMQLSKDIIEGGLEYARSPWGDFSYEGLYDKLSRKEITAQQFEEKTLTMQQRNTDWFKELFTNSISHSHNVNVSGGTEKTKYYFSAGYDNNQGAAIKADMKRFTALGKISVNLNKYIDFTAQINYNRTDNTGYHTSVNPFDYAYKTVRTAPLYDEDGDYSYYNMSSGSKALSYNIMNELNTTGEASRLEGFGSQLALNINLVKGLKYNGTFAYNTSNTSTRNWATDHSYLISKKRGYNFDAYSEDSEEYKASVLPYGGTLSTNNVHQRTYTIRNALNYIQRFDTHEINLFGGVEVRSTKYTGNNVTGYGWRPEFGEMFSPIMTDNFLSNHVMKGDLNPINTNSMSQVASFFGTASYTYDNRYIFNANIRSDGANKFGSNPKYRWLPTWSVAAKWNITGEGFMQHQRWANEIAIRGSYGIQGNIHDDSTPNLIVKMIGVDGFSNQEVINMVRLPNPDLRWEKTKSWNAALDFSLLNRRLSGSFDIYRKYTSDLIMNKSVPTSTGRSFTMINAGEMRNSGFEGNLNAIVIDTKKFGWRFGFSFGRNINEITLANGDIYSNKSEVEQLLTGEIAVEGAPVGSVYSFDFRGLSGKNGYPLFLSKDGREVHEGEAQLMNLVRSGSIYPDLSGGFETQFTFFKRLTLSANFVYNIGGITRLPDVYEDQTRVFNHLQNVSSNVANRWKAPGDEAHTTIPALLDKRNTNFPKELRAAGTGVISIYNFTNLYNMSNERVVKNTFLRLSNVSLQYSIPRNALSKLKISRMDIRFQASNLAVWADKKWQGLDPETSGASIPLLPTFSLGVNISF